MGTRTETPPSGLAPAVTPSCGTSEAMLGLAGGAAGGAGAGAGAAGGAGGGGGGAGGVPLAGSARMAACWATKVVDDAGQPTPGPWRFCKVTRAASIRASWEAFESSDGNETAIEGLLTA
jgi:hypothetical protein